MRDTTPTQREPGGGPFPSKSEMQAQLDEAVNNQINGLVPHGDLSKCELCGAPKAECGAADGECKNAQESTSGSSSKEESQDESGGGKQGGSKGDPSVKHPEKIDSTGDGVPDDHGDIAPPPTWLAWTARILTVGTLAAMILYLVYLILRDPVSARFDIDLMFDEAENRNGVWVLPVEVTNASTESIGNVTVEVTQGDTTRSFELMLMGEGEMGDAEVTFDLRPTEANTEAQVVSYVSP